MANKNYSNYSKPKKETPVEIVEPEVVEEAGLSTAAVITEPVKEPETHKPIIGTVINCEKLNIRADASKSAEVLCVINKGEKVEICEEESTDDWYAVICGKDKEVSVEGYCMRSFILI